jgi:hypothetical protein
MNLNKIMINLATRLILVSVLGFLFALVAISCLTLIPMNSIINNNLFKFGKQNSLTPCVVPKLTFGKVSDMTLSIAQLFTDSLHLVRDLKETNSFRNKMTSW